MRRMRRDKKCKGNELSGVSKQVYEHLLLCVGTMESVPPSILGGVITGSKRIMAVGGEEAVASFGSSMILITDPRSYSLRHRKLRVDEMPTPTNEKSGRLIRQEQEMPEATKLFVSDFLDSPLLQSIIHKGETIPGVVERISITENEEVFRVLSRLILNVVKMADVDGMAALTRQNVLDGIKSVLVRSQSKEALEDAIASLWLVRSIGQNIPQVKYINWEQDYCKSNIDTVLAEITVGNKKRGIVRKKINIRTASRKETVDILSEVDEMKALYGEEPAFQSEKAQNDEKKEKANTKTRRKGKYSTLSKNEENTYEQLEESKRKQESASEPCGPSEPSEASNMAAEKPFVPTSIRIKAALALLNGTLYYGMLPPIRNLIHVLSEGIRLPEGAEAEYLKRKKEKLHRGSSGEDGREHESSDCEWENSEGDMMKDLFDVLQISHCVNKIDALFRHRLLKSEKEPFDIHANSLWDFKIVDETEPMSDRQLKTLVDLLLRLNKFPDNLFFCLSSHCLEGICETYPSQMKRLYFSTFEKQIMEDLACVEEEMKQIEEKECQVRERSIREEGDAKTMIFHTNLKNEYFRSLFNMSNYNLVQFNHIKQRQFTEFDSAAEFECDSELHKELHKLEFLNNSYYMGKAFKSWLNANDNEFPNTATVTAPEYHYSSAAFHFNHTLNCIAAIGATEDCCDDVVLRPFFEKLVWRMGHPFCLVAPVSVKRLACEAYQQQSLESVQNSIDSFVTQMLLNVEKELPYVFAMGFVSTLFEWMLNGKDSNLKVMCLCVQVIRELCIAYTNVSRETRIEKAEPFNKSVVAQRKYFNAKGKSTFDPPKLTEINAVSSLEIFMCCKEYVPKIGNSETACLNYQPHEVDFKEDAEALAKGEDIGLSLLRLIDDAIEESGIRDFVEATQIRRNLELFWLCPGILQWKSEVFNMEAQYHTKRDQMNMLPALEFNLIPFDWFNYTNHLANQ
ncbi:uncharacterized protein MONOS_5024 [Monocercomonoides exilis]|uniref:uncharacterized protein n=1 Tax=Monocercomonoides exilis TaxID=2049356 RepID=UPI0035599EF0|nr:hypothetical protein MONOS_5024 [Monocercomonoides exilis]|eukprot:MONOS_5024.1-p1 / transcript=MONOS_5024.1 / gene=MONOS_5024 / organism=Monocercomonoides_exilis_PA203 / gene_product=unspecified product / transcript_product=unspecified product / location=Mono_scaffold00141:106043-109580(+) / protein_length=966 / sequence_SO=supercontig / SO=protein_coding / is_pseudo=false